MLELDAHLVIARVALEITERVMAVVAAEPQAVGAALDRLQADDLGREPLGAVEVLGAQSDIAEVA